MLLSVLDQSPIRSGGTAAEAVAETLMVVTITHDFKARLRSYQLLAEAFGLPTVSAAAGEGSDTMRRAIGS